ncbi:MAG: hypothetical protein PUD40_06485, partial [Bacteroidales bacterium]|nr:hypothetical protein [Bacteroidales bacterium]
MAIKVRQPNGMPLIAFDKRRYAKKQIPKPLCLLFFYWCPAKLFTAKETDHWGNPVSAETGSLPSTGPNSVRAGNGADLVSRCQAFAAPRFFMRRTNKSNESNKSNHSTTGR